MKTRIAILGTLAIFSGLSSCDSLMNNKNKGNMSIASEPWGTTKDGEHVELFTLKNRNGLEAKIISYGGIIVSFKTPDKKGVFGDVVLGFDKLSDYETRSPYFGTITGRYANRIAKGKFTLDGKEYQLAINNGPNALHGGRAGFDKKVWHAKMLQHADEVALELSRTSPDGEEGYPGNLKCTVTYILTNDDELEIKYHATTDKATVLNLTNHSYFNLAGEGSGTILDHRIMIHSSQFTPTDDGLIPTGELQPVAGTPLDFTTPHRIGDRIDGDFTPLKYGLGYDHNFVLSNHSSGKSVVKVIEPNSGRVLEMETSEPAVQFYSGNHMKKLIGCKNGHTYDFRGGFCLEAQHYPDSPNHPQFPSVVLRPGEPYRQTTTYKFTVE
ncbi:MAG: aldose epimerase family protein [Verrucomicrobiaceae bacterium]